MKSLKALQKEWVGSQNIAPEDFLVLSLHILQKHRSDFFKESDHLLTDKQEKELVALLKRRHHYEPVAYLTGKKEFFGRDFLVNKFTLIPRPETETLVEDVLKTFLEDESKPEAILDIGTGSGAIAITLAQELVNSTPTVLASDIAEAALKVAEKNKVAHQAAVTFLHGSLLRPYLPLLRPKQKIYIVANLPYVSQKLFNKAPLDVRNFEPVTALLSEQEGLFHYFTLLSEILKSGLHGVAWLEISPEQSPFLGEKIKKLFPKTNIFVGKDLSQRERFICFTF